MRNCLNFYAMTLERAKKFTEIAVPWIGVIAILVGGIWTFSEYGRHVDATKVQRSLDQIARFNAELTDIRLKIDLAWQANASTLLKIEQQAELNKAQSDEIAKQYAAFVLNMNRQEQLLSDIARVLFFVDEIVICVEANLCDESTIRSYLDDFSLTFFNRHYPVICDLRDTWNDPTIATRLQAFFTKTSDRNICE